MTAEQLKGSILQLAMQGKLVEQRSEEGTGEELDKKIQAEKKRLIKAGKIKPGKNKNNALNSENLMDIPETWKLVTLQAVAYVTGGFAFKSSAYTEKGVRVIRISDFNEQGFVNTKIVRHPYDDSLSIFRLEEKNILLCMTGGTVGKSHFVTKIDEPMMTNQRVATIKAIDPILPEYLNMVILSPATQKVILNSKNSTNDNISMDTINGFIVPLPPLAEQKRIVAKIEELMPFVEQYAAASTKLNTLNASFPEMMKKSILQEAVQGKLVPQDPNDEPASELLKRIAEEKKRLIKEKKIKKQKPLPEITEDEIPFDIPKSWEWVRMGTISTKITDGSHNPPPKRNKGYRVISARNVKNGHIIPQDDDRFTDQEGFDKENSRTKIKKGDIILGIIGGSIGNTALYDLEESVIAQRSIAIIDTLINNQYLKMIIDSPLVQNFFKVKANGTAQGGVYLGELEKLILPIPPLNEQARILKYLSMVIPLFDSLS